MKEFILKAWKDPRIQSFIHTLITEILWDAAIGAAGGHILTGDMTGATFGMLGYAIFRTTMRVIRDELRKYYKKNV